MTGHATFAAALAVALDDALGLSGHPPVPGDSGAAVETTRELIRTLRGAILAEQARVRRQQALIGLQAANIDALLEAVELQGEIMRRMRERIAALKGGETC